MITDPPVVGVIVPKVYWPWTVFGNDNYQFGTLVTLANNKNMGEGTAVDAIA